MTAAQPPTLPADTLQWLVDRESIRDLVCTFGMSIDDRDQSAFAATFTENGSSTPAGEGESRAEVQSPQ